MKDEDKTKEQLINELEEMRQWLAELERSETERKQAGEALRRACDRLEWRVKERTIDLVTANKQWRQQITGREEAEEALIESEEKYRSLVNDIKLGIFRSTPGPKGTFLAVNPAMEEITGYSREELLQMDVSDLYVHPEEREAVLGEIASDTGKGATELLLRKKDGAEIVVSDTAVAVRDDAGTVMYFDGILEDITARKTLEKRLRELYETEKREREELEEEQKARAQFIHVLAHELKTPLTPLIAGAALLKDILTSAPESREYRLADLTLNGARTLAFRLDELLDLARFATGAVTLKPERLDIRAFCEETTSRFQPVAGEKGQCLILDIPQALAVIEADRSRLEQVLMNLLSNANKFSPEGGRITVRTGVQDSELMIRG